MYDFTINGRFLSQNITGVQRYAYEITKSIGEEIANDTRFQGRIIHPKAGDNANKIENLQNVCASPFSGHIWEQITLPAKTKGLLLNLCNSGPLTKSQQITCIHGANSFVFPDSYSKSFRFSQKILLTSMGGLSLYVTTVSQASANLLYELGIVPRDKKIFVVPNGHEHALSWRPDLSNISTKFQFSRPFILLVGSQSPHKNVKLITSIAHRLDDLGIDIAIAGGNFKVFSNEKPDSTYSKNIIRLGYVSDHDLSYLLSKALCFVFPSLIEGFGLPLVEAMASNCPIVSSNTASMPEVCGDAAILIDPNREDLWLNAIHSLRQNESLRHELISRGKIQMKKFSWKESGKAYLRLIKAV